MAQGDIKSRLLLDKRSFSNNLNAALKEGRDFASALSGSLGKSVALPKVSADSYRAVNSELKQQNALRDVRDAVSNLRVAYERGELSRTEFLQQAR